jgi:hypothetical protein
VIENNPGYEFRQFVLSQRGSDRATCSETDYLAVAHCLRESVHRRMSPRDIAALTRCPQQSVEVALRFMATASIVLLSGGNRYTARSETIVSDAMLALWNLDPNRTGVATHSAADRASADGAATWTPDESRRRPVANGVRHPNTDRSGSLTEAESQTSRS